MAAASNNNVRRYLLLAVLVIVGLFFIRQYLPVIEIPTDGRIAEEQQRLQSKLSDLAVQKKMNEDWDNKLVNLRDRASIFWVRVRQGMPVEQEVLEEFNNIARNASVNIQSRTPHLGKNVNASYIQEVDIKIELRGITMKEFSRLLREISRNRRKFHWVSCKIEPDNLQKPTGIKVNGSLRAFVLNDDGMRLIGSAPVTNTTVPAKTTEPANSTSTVKKIERKPRVIAPSRTGVKFIGKPAKEEVK